MTIIYFDCETNSTPSHHRIIQFSYICVTNGKPYVFDTLVKQDVIDKRTPYITGITQHDVTEYGVSESELATHIKSLLSNKPIMVAHNCQFDLHMIHDLIARYYSSETAYDLCSNCHWIDTLTIAKDRFSYNAHGGHTLAHCIEHYDCSNVTNSHNALDDTKALMKVFQAMHLERPDCIKYINVFGYNPEYPLYEKDKFDFITYKPQYYRQSVSMDDSDDILPLK